MPHAMGIEMQTMAVSKMKMSRMAVAYAWRIPWRTVGELVRDVTPRAPAPMTVCGESAVVYWGSERVRPFRRRESPIEIAIEL